MSGAQVDYYAQASALAREFPVLRDAPGIAPFDAPTLARWARRQGSTATQQAAAFVLSVFNFKARWAGLPMFNAVHAMAVWDDAQRAVFRRWCIAPWNL